MTFTATFCYNGVIMSKKKTHEEFIEEIKDRLNEYEILSTYETANTKMRFRHKVCGNEFMMKPISFIRGEGCRACAYKQKAKRLMKTEQDFLKSVHKKYKGWIFTGYTKVSAPITATCPKCGRTHTYCSCKPFIQGSAGCRVCSNSKRKPDKHYEILCRKQGLTFIRKEGRSIIAKCNECGAICTKNNSNIFKNGCRKCAYRKQADKNRFTLEQVNEKMLKNNYPFKFITYKGAQKNALVECQLCGEQFKTKAVNCLTGHSGCPNCSTRSSIAEKEIYQWIKSLCPDAVASDRSVLKALGKGGQELDIYVPSKKVAIEYNGRYWHSIDMIMKSKGVSYAEAKRYHYMKSYECEKQGVRLIHIWDYEWADPRKQKVLKNIILGALGMLPERYYARNTVCKHYKKDCERWAELNQFFAENNIQGNRGGSDVFTLEDKNGRILMAYKFGRPSGGRAKQLYEYEMVRGASAYGVQVVGGASKLWKHFVDTLKPNSVVYYIDYNYFDGRSVEKLGGKFITSQPGVKNYWVELDEVKNRQPAKHREVMEAIRRGEVLEIWNAGTKTYAFDFTASMTAG